MDSSIPSTAPGAVNGDSIMAQTSATFLRPMWGWANGAVWLLALAVLAVLAALRGAATLGPPSARPLFLVHVLLMWALPFLFLTRQGRREIGLTGQGNGLVNLTWSALAGASMALIVYAAGMGLYGESADNWCVSIRDSFQLTALRAAMPNVPLAGLFAMIAVPALLFTPLGEEFLFRGFLHQAFARRWGAVVATAVNSLAFGLIHLHVHGIWRDASGFHIHVVSGALMVLAMAATSVVFTLCRMRGGSLWSAVVAHASCNLVMIAAVFYHYVR
jgi:membrane protease YdiL (CAAX protease family)